MTYDGPRVIELHFDHVSGRNQFCQNALTGGNGEIVDQTGPSESRARMNA